MSAWIPAAERASLRRRQSERWSASDGSGSWTASLRTSRSASSVSASSVAAAAAHALACSRRRTVQSDHSTALQASGRPWRCGPVTAEPGSTSTVHWPQEALPPQGKSNRKSLASSSSRR